MSSLFPPSVIGVFVSKADKNGEGVSMTSINLGNVLNARCNCPCLPQRFMTQRGGPGKEHLVDQLSGPPNRKERAAMRCLRIYATPDGESHFDEVDLPMTQSPVHPDAAPFEVSASYQGSFTF